MATDEKNRSVKLNLPKAFDGSRDKFRKFLQTAKIYLGINKKVYDDNLKKIGFILSFMTEGQAEAWCYNFRIYSAISLYSCSVLSEWQYLTVMSPSSRFNLST